MRYLTRLLTTIFLLLLLIGCNEKVQYDDLVERGGLYYKKTSANVFTGTVVGKYRGKVINGMREGTWVQLWDNGQLYWRLNYKNGKTDGLYESYFKNGQLSSRGKFKNGSMVGKWKFYNDGGTLNRVEEY